MSSLKLGVRLTLCGSGCSVCVICQIEYEEGEVQMKLPCLHKFHQACGAEWLLNYSKICPVCKHDVTESSGPSTV